MDLFINFNNNIKNTLFLSVLHDDYDEFLKKMFNYVSLLDYKNHFGESLLHYVSFYGMIDKYYALVNMGAKIDKTNSLNNLLHYASLSGKDNFLIVELIKNNLDPVEQNIHGQTSVHLCENDKIAHYLNLWCNRNNVSILNLKDKKGNSVLHTAKKLGNLNTVDYWIKHYPSLNFILNNNNQTWNDINTTETINTIY